MDYNVLNFAGRHGITNPLNYGAAEETVFDRFAAESGYERKTTFFSDLSIAEWYGLESVKDTYKNVVKSWLSNVEFFTEFVLSLNWKSWEWAERGHNELGQLYSDLYYKANDLAYKTYKGEDLDYYFRTTD